MKIIGTEHISFKSRTTGNTITGYNLYVTSPIATDKGEGLSAEKLFITDDKASKLDFKLAAGIDVEILFNRYGKVATLRLLEGAAVDFD